MQCSSCGFENMPGSDACGRCGSSLRLATMVMDVQPPRAGKIRKKLRRVLPVAKAGYAMRDSFEKSRMPKAAAAVGRVAGDLYGDKPPWPVMWRLIVPGWSHFRTGQRVRGHIYLWTFLLFLVPGLLLLGGVWGSTLLGLAFSVHASAAFDVFNQAAVRPSMREMIARSMLVTVALALCVYLPAYWAMSRVADVRTLQMPAEPFRAGDVVLVNRAAHRSGWPWPGQVVMYQLPTMRTEGIRVGYQGNTVYEYAGARIDRVLAVGGDKVVWEKGALKVNGVPSAWRPLNPAALPVRVELAVPVDCVAIFPTTTPHLATAIELKYLEKLSCIPRDQVIGTVYLRKQPLSRFGRIR